VLPINGNSGFTRSNRRVGDRPANNRSHRRLQHRHGRISIMIGPSSSEVETSLAAAVQNYLLAEPNDYISEDKNLRSVCSWLGRWLRDMLENTDGWGPYRSMDDVSPCTADRRSSTDLELRGLLIWMDDGTREWKEPLFARIHLSGNPSAPMECKVLVGDADRGLGKVSHGTAHDYPFVPVERWLFTFAVPRTCAQLG